MRRKKRSYRNKGAKFFEKASDFKKKLRMLTILDNKKKFGKDFKHQNRNDRMD